MPQSSNLLSQNSIEILKNSSNLLAFSAGVDSTALFFLLLEREVEFDIAIVDYQKRDSSKEEVSYAKELANRFGKKIYLHSCKIEGGNFEKRARDERYNFFKSLIKKHDYQNLITAHQLNDKLEWFLMQLLKGAGLIEILGFEEIEERENYNIIRPLLNTSKDELLEYLKKRQIRYFIDETNVDHRYRRNLIRDKFSNTLLDLGKDGIIKSFSYLQVDKELIFEYETKRIEDLIIIKRSKDFIRGVDKALKSLGYLLSKAQRDEIKREVDMVIGTRFVVAFSKEYIYISPYIKDVMPKEFKELCRIFNIPPKIRPYIYKKRIDLNSLHI